VAHSYQDEADPSQCVVQHGRGLRNCVYFQTSPQGSIGHHACPRTLCSAGNSLLALLRSSSDGQQGSQGIPSPRVWSAALSANLQVGRPSVSAFIAWCVKDSVSPIFCRVQRAILRDEPTHQVIAKNYPLFLWRDSTFSCDDPCLGFLQNMLLVKVRWSPLHMANTGHTLLQALRHIAANPTSEGGYAALNGVMRVTIPAIAYSAVMVGVLHVLMLRCSSHHRCISHSQATWSSLRTVGHMGSSLIKNSTLASSRLCSCGRRMTVRLCCCGGPGT